MAENTAFTPEKLRETADGIFGLSTCIPSASETLGLTNEQIGIFLENTPNGEELWVMFTDRRDAEGAIEGYNFTNFMREVLAEAGHPIEEKVGG